VNGRSHGEGGQASAPTLMTDPRTEYEDRLRRWRNRIAALDRRHLLMSNTRLAVAAAIAILCWLAFISDTISPWWVVIGGLGFGTLAVAHARLLQRADRARRAARMYERGLDRLHSRWAGTGRGGDAFLEQHPYARDLDLFGRASLFELLNTAQTEIGESTLADWLRAGADVEEVTARQAAVDELRPMLEFREEIAVLAAESHVGRTGPLAAWALAAPAWFPRGLRASLLVCSLVTAALALAVYEEAVGSEWFILWIFVEVAFASIWRRRFEHVLHAIDTPEHDLALLSAVLAAIERQRFVSPRLTALHQALITAGVPPSRRIARLRSLVSWVDSTHNLLFAPIAYVLVLKQQLALAINRWHAAYGSAVAEWLDVVGEIEALSALATYAFEHPADPFPGLTDDGPVFDAEALGHPLIPDQAAVRNDVRLAGTGQERPRVIVLSGSNMSGKSTLLRSVGVNVVLGLAGAPVRAARLRLSPLAIGATLRVEDSLQAGYSRFYAEILRIRAIVALTNGGVPVLFLLDEILHGTNSYDRRIGAEAIVRSLVSRGAIGLVTTHDLALTELPARLGPAAMNMHFEDRLEDGRMVFDYRMRPGVVEHSNALALMRAIGLDV
jgi:hypothetical protein